MNVRVFKFGGSSLNTSENIEKVFKIIASNPKKLCVVISSITELTDEFTQFYKFSTAGDSFSQEASLKKIENYFIQLVNSLLSKSPSLSHVLNELSDQIKILKNAGLELTSRSASPSINQAFIVSFGERILALILYHLLKERNLDPSKVESIDLIRVTQTGTESFPNEAESKQLTKHKLLPLLKAGPVVISGSYALKDSGEMVLLDKGGADFFACLIASYIGAEEVCLFKDYDGIKTADPKHVYQARTIPELHYREAVELAYFGANILHPRSIIPLVKDSIPLRIQSAFFPHSVGTKISSQPSFETFPVKGLSFIENQAMISIEGKGMMGVPGVASKAFGVMAQENISVSLITQASSESSICFIVPGTLGDLAARKLKLAFRPELQSDFIDEIRVTENLSIIAIVGLGMKGTPGIAARAFSAIAREKININAIAQGASELNISLVTASDQATKALRSLHKEYGLEHLRGTTNPSLEHIHISFLGFGQIGKSLARQIIDQTQYFQSKLKIECHVVSVSDKSGLIINENSFSDQQLEEFIEQKSSEKKFSDFYSGKLSNDLDDLGQLTCSRKVLVDLTSSDSLPIIKNALKSGFHVVLANKKPLTCPYKEWIGLFEIAEQENVQIRYEATVGAGLPVLDTIDKLIESGDQVIEILGCLSGTLGYLMSKLEDGVTFSEAVREAYQNGYTEPDPRDDLSGVDVARKALILARTIGFKDNFEDIKLVPLIEDTDHQCDVSTFLDKIQELNSRFSLKMTSASQKGNVLRYVARISKSGISVGLEEISKESSLGRLKGTDNQVTITTQRYKQNPLIVTGPGAGAEVTAAGVLNDIIYIASSHERIKVI
jgi:aspartokinase/homoserine dehydrogenase 1